MITMYDDTNVVLIPASAQAVAGYVNGRWPTYNAVVKRFPKAHHLSIAVTSHADADCLDVEPGDATNAVAPAWVKRQVARGVHRPVVYTSTSNAMALVRTLAAAGIARSSYRLWTAHYTKREHLCSPVCGFGMTTTADATQFSDRALGRSLDQSVCQDNFFFLAPKPKPVPTPTPKPVPVPVPKPVPVPPFDTLSADPAFWLWVSWRDGTGPFTGYGPQNQAVRPGFPASVPDGWYMQLSAFRASRPT